MTLRSAGQAGSITRLPQRLRMADGQKVAVKAADGVPESPIRPSQRAQDSTVPQQPSQGQGAWRKHHTVFTNAKAGMDGVDRDHVQRIVYEMSKVSFWFRALSILRLAVMHTAADAAIKKVYNFRHFSLHLELNLLICLHQMNLHQHINRKLVSSYRIRRTSKMSSGSRRRQMRRLHACGSAPPASLRPSWPATSGAAFKKFSSLVPPPALSKEPRPPDISKCAICLTIACTRNAAEPNSRLVIPHIMAAKASSDEKCLQ